MPRKEFVAFTRLDASDVNEYLVNRGELREVISFTSSGTFTKASYDWLAAIKVRVQGAGGGGAGAPATTGANVISAGDGGGGGGYAESFITDIAGLADTITVTVGSGGAGGSGNDGAAGGSSSFGTAVAANGGDKGEILSASSTLAVNTSFGAGGSATAGQIQIHGGDGSQAERAYTGRSIGGSGGSSQFGGERRGRSSVSTSQPGQTGYGFGGGGSGASNSTERAAASGGNGASGIVIIELYG